ncbi:Ig-like domain-containing protein [Tenacibaculum agarivorans]|uniref:Ig-like domain-containing protein n=1 Tax=Tenacibaculum agarivorans TaxID=1908389 RepID=UPI00094B9E19|nr:Ig-like domain-containing protein [Tenacibaculum agarivorans]
MRKTLLSTLFFIFSLTYLFAQDVPFTQRLQAGGVTLRGDITFIGNNILNRDTQKTGDLAKQNPNGSFSIFTGNENPNVPYDSDLFLPSFFGGTVVNASVANNGNLFMDYIDIDDIEGISGSSETFSSSKSQLNLPSCSKVVYAGLYWTAVYPFDTWETEGARSGDYRNIKFKLPGESYQDITSDEVIYDAGIATQRPYLCYKDITTMVNNLSNPNGDYFAGNIRATTGLDINYGLGGAAGWTMVVIYENSIESTKSISVFDGFSTIDGANATDVTFDGFMTVPSGPVRAQFLTAALEGDTYIQGDAFQIKNTSGNYVDISTPTTNTSTNFFNGSITQYDNYVTNRNPDSENTLGFDIDLFEINNPGNTVISNNQTSINARFTTSGDVYWAFLNAISVEVSTSEIQLVKTIDDNSGNDLAGAAVGLGSDVWYNLSFQNIGSDDATNTVITDELPKNVNLITSDIVLPVGVSLSSYDPPAIANDFRGALTFTVDDTLVQETGAVHSIRYHTQVDSDCTNFTDACASSASTAASIDYTGINSGIQIVDQSSFSGIDACNIGIEGPTYFLIDISSCNIEQNVELCGASVTLTAGSGFGSYEWRDSSGAVLGTTQSLVVTSVGKYTVSKVNTTGTSAACIALDETFNVTTSSTSGLNPLVNLADSISTCPNDPNLILYEMYVCGVTGSRNIATGIVSPSIVTWQQLQTSSNPQPDNSCPDVNGTWVDVATNANSPTRNFSEEGQYRLVIESEGGCQTVHYFNIIRQEVNAAIAVVDKVCNIEGSIIVSNVPAGYEYAVAQSGVIPVASDYQVSNIFSIANEGSYDVYVRNSATLCTSTYYNIIVNKAEEFESVTVSQVEALNCINNGEFIFIEYASNDPTTVADVHIKDSSGNLIETITGVSRDTSVRNTDYLPVGTYTITVESQYTGCEKSVNYEVQPIVDYIADVIVASPVICLGDSNGSVELTINASTPYTGSYGYTLFNTDTGSGGVFGEGVGNTPTTITDVSAGSYYAEITQNEFPFCTIRTNNFVVDGPSSPLFVTADVFNSDSILATGIGGTAPYEYSIDGGLTFSTSNIFSGLASGTYIVTIRDANGCVFTSTEVNLNATLATTFVTTPINCFGLNDGTVTIAVTGGTPPYSYELTDPIGTVIVKDNNVDNSYVFAGLTAGNYIAKVVDSAGQEVVVTFDIVEPAPIQYTASVTQSVNCFQKGEIIFGQPTGGTPPYEYGINGTFTSDLIKGNLEAGVYDLSVRDANGCESTLSAVVISEDQPLALFITSDRDRITGTITGGLPPYNYMINSTNETMIGGDTFTEILAPGTYDILVQDANGCITSEIVTIADPTPFANDDVFTVDENATIDIDVLANDVISTESSVTYTNPANGQLTINDSGTADIADDIVTYIPDANFVGVDSFTYSICADYENSNYCDTATVTITVNPSSNLDVSFTIFPITCSSSNDGAVEVLVNGGTPPYSYTLLDNTGVNVIHTSSDNSFTNLAPGHYTVKVTDSNGFEALNSFVVNEPAPVALTTDFIAVDSFIVTATGGIPPYQYSIDGGNSFTTDNVFNSLASGTYSVIAKDANGCISSPAVVTINPKPDLEASVVINNITCNGKANGIIEMIATGGTPPYRYLLDDRNTGLVVMENTSGVFSNVEAGNYNVIVRDNAGGQVILNAVLEEPEAIEITTITTNVSCNGSNDGIVTVNAIGGTGSLVYEISSQLGKFQTENTFTDLAPGNYSITVLDTAGCIATTTVEIKEPESLFINSIDIRATGKHPSGRIKIGAEGGTPKYKYSINNGPFKRSNRFLDLADGSYTVIVQDDNGCLSNSLTVTIDKIEIENTVEQIANILEALFKNANAYQWIDVDNDVRIAGATKPTYKPTKSGRYQVEMILGGSSTTVSNKTVIRKNNTQVVLSPVIEYDAGVLSVEEETEKIFKLYPNPADEYLNIPLDILNKEYTIYSIHGKEVLTGSLIHERLIVESLAKGVYVLYVEGYKPIRFMKK